jgi:hypothetical protein
LAPPKIPALPLCRAVTDPELADIQTSQKFTGSPNGSEVKYFTPDLSHASRYARFIFRCVPADGPYTAVNGSIDGQHVTSQLKVVVDCGIQSIVLPLTLLNQVTFISTEDKLDL